MSSGVRNRPLLAVVVLLAVLSACSQAESPTTPAAELSGVGAFGELVRAPGLQVDYEPLSTPEEAAAIADLVARGTLVSVVQGRDLIVEADNPSVDVRSIVVGVRLDEVYAGSLGKEGDGIAYIQLPKSPLSSIGDYREALPTGTEAALYLTLLPQEDPLYRDDEAGRPKGQRIWVPISPQGLVLADGAQSVELLSGIRFDESLDAFLPPSPSFPSSESG